MTTQDTKIILEGINTLRGSFDSSINQTTKEIGKMGQKIVRLETQVGAFAVDLEKVETSVSEIKENKAETTAKLIGLEAKIMKIPSQPPAPAVSANNVMNLAKSAGIIITAFVAGVGTLLGFLWKFGLI